MQFLPSPPKKTASVSASPTVATPPIPPSPQRLIHPAVWLLFLSSLLIAGLALFTSRWTSSGPTLFSSFEVNGGDRALPLFLQLPSPPWEQALPLGLVLGLCLCLRWIPVTNATRLLVKLLLLVLGIRYFIWRTLATLNFAHWSSTLFSLVLYGVELICFLSLVLYTLQTIWSTHPKRRHQADRAAQAVTTGDYLPSVDVFVPTYNEPDYIVRRTVIGCQAMDYANKTIYILDDTRRPHIHALATELGCEYITRPDNAHAKAGNLNHALGQTQGELITVMDADFVPFRHFLQRTVGFFQDPQITLVQTPQNFYNPDYHARNLGLEHFLPNDLEHFYGLLQTNRDSVNSVICCGSSYVVRRQNLLEIGGYYTRCCVEDYQTSLRLLAQGARLVYLNETLSMGESTRTYADYIDQRLRWLQGNFQVYFCGDELPIWSAFNLAQKSFAVSQLFYCFNPFFRLAFLLAPVLTFYLGVSPYLGTLPEVLYFFAPFWLLLIAIYGWASDYRGSYFWSEIYEVIFCLPAVNRMLLLLRNPFAKTSRVTRKGVKADRKNFNFNLTWPLLLLLGLAGLPILLRWLGAAQGLWIAFSDTTPVMLFWVLYNSGLIGVALLSAVDQPVRRTLDRFPLQTPMQITMGDRDYWGYSQNVSEGGALIQLTQAELAPDASQWPVNSWVHVRFWEQDVEMPAHLLRIDAQDGAVAIAVQFIDLTTNHYRHLVDLLYTDMTGWKERKQPGGIDSTLALLAAVLTLRPMTRRYAQR
jgi:cellulose synthase (UDP-forming)